MTTIASKPIHGETIGFTEHSDRVEATPELQAYLDDIEQRLNSMLLGASVRLPVYTVATVPDASAWNGSWIHVSDETGGAVPAFSDGTNWRRCTDRAVVS